MKTFTKDAMTAIRAVLFFTLLTGLVYPLSLNLFAKAFYRQKAEGSVQVSGGELIGSELIGQSFSDPKYFWGRPSAIKYDAASSGGSNLGSTSADWMKAVKERESQGLVAEMRFASGSGLDPHISPAAAYAQLSRVAHARRLDASQEKLLRELIAFQIEGRQFGLLGQPRVNVLRLNLKVREKFGNE